MFPIQKDGHSRLNGLRSLYSEEFLQAGGAGTSLSCVVSVPAIIVVENSWPGV